MHVSPILVALLAGAYASGPESATGLEAVAFMQGCWRGPLGGVDGDFVEERWAPPAGDLMLGTVVYVRAGRPTQHEFAEIRATPEGELSFLPYPGGQRSPDAFILTSGDGTVAVFEAPEHDFPKRITYRAVGADGLEGSADAGADDPAPRRWPMRRIPCDGDAAGAEVTWRITPAAASHLEIGRIGT